MGEFGSPLSRSMQNGDFWIRAGAASAAVAVATGALGAHALRARLSPEKLDAWNTASRYQLAHSIALVIVGHMMASGHTHIGPAANAFAAGIAGFSGSIYLLSLGIGPRGVLGPVTPLGGLLLIAGWGLLALRAGKR